MKIWIQKIDSSSFLAFLQTDHRFEVFGGPVTSDGIMSGQLIIKQPKLDRRFKDQKKYEKIQSMPCFIECQGYPNSPITLDFSTLEQIEI